MRGPWQTHLGSVLGAAALLASCATTTAPSGASVRQQAQVALEQGAVKQATELLEELHDRDEATEDDTRLLAEAWLRLGRPGRALALLEPLVARHPDQATLRRLAARAAAAAGRISEAIAHYEAAGPTLDADDQATLAALRLDAGDPQGASEAARAALAQAPHLLRAQLVLGRAAWARGASAEAIGILQRAVATHPDEADAHLALADTLLATGSTADAIAAYSEALRLRPAFPEALHNLGAALLVAGEPAEAARVLRRAARLAPDSVEVHNNLAVALVGAGALDEAAEHIEQAARLAPGALRVQANRAEVYMRLGRLEEAVAAQRHVVALARDDPAMRADATETLRHLVAMRAIADARCAGQSDSLTVRRLVADALRAAGIGDTEEPVGNGRRRRRSVRREDADSRREGVAATGGPARHTPSDVAAGQTEPRRPQQRSGGRSRTEWPTGSEDVGALVLDLLGDPDRLDGIARAVARCHATP